MPSSLAHWELTCPHSLVIHLFSWTASEAVAATPNHHPHEPNENKEASKNHKSHVEPPEVVEGSAVWPHGIEVAPDTQCVAEFLALLVIGALDISHPSDVS